MDFGFFGEGAGAVGAARMAPPTSARARAADQARLPARIRRRDRMTDRGGDNRGMPVALLTRRARSASGSGANQAGQANLTDFGVFAEPSALRSWTNISISDGAPSFTCTRNWMWRASLALTSKL